MYLIELQASFYIRIHTGVLNGLLILESQEDMATNLNEVNWGVWVGETDG